MKTAIESHRWDFLIAFFMVVVLGSLVSWILFDLHRNEPSSRPRKSWSTLWEFSATDLGWSSYHTLILASLLGLFLELLLIRWVSSEIRIFAYYKNFVLIACFLGFGLGCYLSRRPINLLPTVLPLVLLGLLIDLPVAGLQYLIQRLPTLLGALTEVQVWGVPSLQLNWSTFIDLIAAILVIVPVFALLAITFVPIGQLVGWHLEHASRGVLAYSLNILGSLMGILLYTILCFLYQPPAVWFIVAGILLTLLVWKRTVLRWTALAGMALCVGLVSVPPKPGFNIYWTPYQKLSLAPEREKGQITAYFLFTNNTGYQRIVDLSPQFVASHPHLFAEAPLEFNGYNIPYRFQPAPSSVLILGAGMGNDVAAALRNGATRVVAVEIDPQILELGRKLHFEKPYDSLQVTQVLDDARSYIQNSRDQFDLIVFSLLDSHTTTSHYTNIRIDNYVYTVEALEAAKRLLSPHGILVLKFMAETPWIAGRLQGLVKEVFGYRPVVVRTPHTSYATEGTFFIAGSEEQLRKSLSDERLAAYVQAHPRTLTENVTLTTDDWPYLYQHEPGLPLSVLLISSVLAVLGRLAMRRTMPGDTVMQWHFFFLGAAFLLLEVQIISKIALLFGTTWVVTSIVITGLLLLIVGANSFVELVRVVPAGPVYAGLFASLAASYLIPLDALFFQSVWLRGVAAIGVLCLPVFFAGIIFIQSFARAGFSGDALGSNLMGSLVGGLLESLSFWTGIKALLLLAALLYLLSYFALDKLPKKTPLSVATTPDTGPAKANG